MLAARKNMAYDEVIDNAAALLTADQCEPGVPDMVRIVTLDAPFPDGTKLVTLIDPIIAGENDIRPGEIIVGDEPIELFGGAERPVTDRRQPRRTGMSRCVASRTSSKSTQRSSSTAAPRGVTNWTWPPVQECGSNPVYPWR